MRLIITFLLLLPVLCSSNQDKEGITVAYELVSTVPTIDGSMGTVKEQITLLSQGDKLRIEQQNGREKCELNFPGWIADFKEKTITTLVDSRGRKLKTVLPFDQCKSVVGKLGDETKVQLLPGSKVILGYTCKRAVYNKIEIWYTPALPVYLSPEKPNLLKSAVLQLTDGPFQYTAKKISKGKITDSCFNASQRELITNDELQKINQDCLQLR